MKVKKTLVALLAMLCTCGMLSFAVAGCTVNGPGENPPQGEQPGGDQPGGDQPGGDQPGGDQPGGDQPGGDDPVIDYEPKIALAEGAPTQYSVQVGEALTLPVATASDETDGDISADVWIKADMNNKFADIQTETEDGKIKATFLSNTAGTHTVTYTVENSWGMSAETSVSVQVVGKTEDGENEFSNIDELIDGGKFVENFADFKSDFVKNISGSHIKVKATEEAIEGNSIVIDYSGLVGGDNLIAMQGLSSYFKSGTWKVSFDVKLVSGSPDGNFLNSYYIGYRNVIGDKQTNVQITQLNPAVGTMAVGDTVTVTYDCNLVEVAASDNYYFHLFVNDLKENDVVLAYDNFVFEYVAFDVTTERATFDQISAEGGVTYDFVNKFTAIDNAKPVKKADIADETANAALNGEGVEGFSETVMEISNASDMHNIAAFNAESLQKGYAYTLTITAYKCDDAGHHLILMREAGPNTTLKSNFMTQGEVGTYTITFEYKEEDATITAINLYGKYSAYIGSITLTAEEIIVPEAEFTVSECKTDVTQEEYLNGYVYTQEEGNYASTGTYEKIALMEEGDPIKAEIAAAEGFSESVWLVKATSGNGVYIGALQGKFVAGYTYTVEFNAYVSAFNGGCVLMMNEGGGQNGSAKSLVKENISGNLYKFTVIVEAVENDAGFMFYPQGGDWELYIGNISVTAEKTPDSSWTPLVNKGDKLVENFSDRKLGLPSNLERFKIEKIEGNAVLSCAFEGGANTLFFNVSGADGSTSLLQEGKTYSVTFRYKTDAAMNLYFGYQPDGGNSVFEQSAPLTVSEEWQTATLSFTVAVTENNPKKHLQLYSGDTANVCLDDVVIECIGAARDSSWTPLAEKGATFTENFYDLKLGTPSNTANFKVEMLEENEVLSCTFAGGSSTLFFNVSGNDGASSLLQEGKTYSVTFRYKTDAAMNLYFGYQPDGGNSVFEQSAPLTVSEEWQTATLSFFVAATENNPKKHLQLYSGDTANVYLDDVVIKCLGGTKDSSWSPLAEVGDSLTEDFYDLKLGTPSNTVNFKVEMLENNDVLNCKFGSGASTYFFNVSGADGSSALLQEGRTYTVTFRYKTDAALNLYFGYQPEGGNSVFGSVALTVSEEWQTATLTFTVAATDNNPKKHLQLYSGDTANVCLDDVVIECTQVAGEEQTPPAGEEQTPIGGEEQTPTENA